MRITQYLIFEICTECNLGKGRIACLINIACEIVLPGRHFSNWLVIQN